jgi:hypothetical protein
LAESAIDPINSRSIIPIAFVVKAQVLKAHAAARKQLNCDRLIGTECQTVLIVSKCHQTNLVSVFWSLTNLVSVVVYTKREKSMQQYWVHLAQGKYIRRGEA